MSRSAILSSSMVLTSGWHASLRGGSTAASRLPARAMRSISWAVFRLIIGSSLCALGGLSPPTRPSADLPGERGGGDGGHHLAAYLINCAHAVDLRNQALAAVVVEHGDGLLEVDLDPGLDRFRLVVLPLHQCAAVGRAGGGARRVGALADRADEPAGEAAEQLLEVDLEVEDAVEPAAEVVHHVVEGHGLGDRAREAVDDETPLRVRLPEAVGDHRDHDLVRDVVARGQDGLGLLAERGAGRDLGAEHVAGGDVWDSEMRAQHVGLGPLAAARGAVEEQVHLMKPRYWRMTSWVCSCFIVSRATPTTMSMAVPPRYICWCEMPEILAVAIGRITVMKPRKVAPAKVTRFMTAAR